MNPKMLALVVIGLAGFVLVSTFSLTIVVSQSLLPTRGGTAAGLMVGFAVPLLALPFMWALPADAPAAARRLKEAKSATH